MSIECAINVEECTIVLQDSETGLYVSVALPRHTDVLNNTITYVPMDPNFLIQMIKTKERLLNSNIILTNKQ